MSAHLGGQASTLCTWFGQRVSPFRARRVFFVDIPDVAFAGPTACAPEYSHLVPHVSNVIRAFGDSDGLAHFFFPSGDAESLFVANPAVQIVPCRVPSPDCEDELRGICRLPNPRAIESEGVVLCNSLKYMVANGLRRVLVNKTITILE